MLTIAEFQAARSLRTLKRVDCPHCGQHLNGAGPIVVSTRNCPACGRRVLAEPEDDTNSPPFTAKQIADAQQTHTRMQTRLGWVAVVLFFVWFAGLVVLALFRDTIHDAVRPFMSPDWVFMSYLLVPMLGGMIAFGQLLHRSERAAPKCPHCSAGLRTWFGSLVRVSGNCSTCGRRLLTDPLPEEPPGPLPTIDQFKSSVDRLKRGGTFDGLLVCGLMLAVFVGFVITAKHLGDLVASIEEQNGTLLAALVLAGVLIVWGIIASVVLIGGMRWTLRRQRKRREADPVLNCPHCRSALLSESQIIASRRCPECRRRVLAEPEPVAGGVMDCVGIHTRSAPGTPPLEK